MRATEVDRVGEFISRNRVLELENYNPENRVVFTANHMVGNFRFLFRMNWYDDWVDGNFNGDPDYDPTGPSYNLDCAVDYCYKGEFIFDMEAAYTFNDKYTIVVGGMNIFDQDAPLDQGNTNTEGFSNNSGALYTESSHWGINGGFWYLRANYVVD